MIEIKEVVIIIKKELMLNKLCIDYNKHRKDNREINNIMSNKFNKNNQLILKNMEMVNPKRLLKNKTSGMISLKLKIKIIKRERKNDHFSIIFQDLCIHSYFLYLYLHFIYH